MCRASEAPRMGANRTGMVFTPGWTKKPGRAAQLCRTATECRDTAPLPCPLCRATCCFHYHTGEKKDCHSPPEEGREGQRRWELT